MPQNPKTGKTDCHPPTEEDFLEFRIKQVEEKHVAGDKKGMRCTCNSPGTGEPETSESVLSPLQSLVAMQGLTLESGGSSSGNTPADSTASLLQPPFSETPAPAPSTSSKSCALKRMAGKSVSEPA